MKLLESIKKNKFSEIEKTGLKSITGGNVTAPPTQSGTTDTYLNWLTGQMETKSDAGGDKNSIVIHL